MEDRNLSNVYIRVIKDVVNKVSDDFINSEAGEEVLNELQATWEEKMLQCGVVSNKPPSRRSITPFVHSVDDQSAPYEGLTEKYKTPAKLWEEKTLQSGVISNKPPSRRSITPFVHSVDDQSATYEGLTEKYETLAETLFPPQHSHSTNKQAALGVDINVADEENHHHEDIGDSDRALAQEIFVMPSRKRKKYDNPAPVSLGCQMLEDDGSGDVTIEFILPKRSHFDMKGTDVTPLVSPKAVSVASLHPQEDHLAFHGVADVDHNTLTDQGQWGD